MINMKMEKEEMGEYSYGLCIRLDKEAMEKLSMKEMPKLGDKMMIHAMVEVKMTTESEYNRAVELQITDMEFVSNKEMIPTAEVMYGK